MNQDSGRYKKDDEKHVLTGTAELFFAGTGISCILWPYLALPLQLHNTHTVQNIICNE